MAGEDRNKLVGIRLYMVMLGMLLSGTANTILMKVQNSTPGEEGKKFNHPFVQCAIMFMGELLCLVAYGAKLFYNRNNKDAMVPMSPGSEAAGLMHLKTNINPLLLAIPATFDIIGSTLVNIALTMIPASVYQMLISI